MSGSNGLKLEHLAALNQLIRFGARGFDRLSVPGPRFEFARSSFGMRVYASHPKILSFS